MKGISHITWMCKDIIRSAQFFCDLFDAQEIYSSDEHNFSLSKEKFLLIGDLWIALMQGNPIERSYNHIAFHIDEDELTNYESKIKKHGLDILPSRPRDESKYSCVGFSRINFNLNRPQIDWSDKNA